MDFDVRIHIRIPLKKPSLANYSNTKFILSCSNIYHCGGVFVNQKKKNSINHGLMDMLVFMHACGGCYRLAGWDV